MEDSPKPEEINSEPAGTADQNSDQPTLTDQPETAEPADSEEKPTPETATEPADSAPAQSQAALDEADTEITSASVIEAVLFATDEPITPQKLVEILGTGNVKEVRKHIEACHEACNRVGGRYVEAEVELKLEDLLRKVLAPTSRAA